jgi:membrane-bound lytic murein transglycosylase D
MIQSENTEKSSLNLKQGNGLAIFISVCALILVIGHILYISNRQGVAKDSFSDEVSTTPTIPFPVEGGPIVAVAFALPKEISFANEKMPLDIIEVRERLDRELQINCYLHSSTIFLMKRANRWLPQIEKILKDYNIPEDFKYLPLIESNLVNAISPKEAVGFWQILKDSGKEFGLEVTNEVDERYDPIRATEAACRYLNKAYQKFGNWTLVAASYNRGMSGIQRALEDQDVDNYYDLYLNEETSRYVFRIAAIKEIFENPSKYGFKIDKRLLYPQEETRSLIVKESISDLVSFAKKHGSTYKDLKRLNPWLRSDALTVKNKTYTILLPKN